MKNKLFVRQYQKQDFKEVWDLHVLALKCAGTYVESGKWDEDLKNIGEVYLRNGAFLVGLIDNKIVAMGALKRMSEDLAEIKRMRVDPKCQRQGFGQQILNLLEEKARKLGIKTLKLHTPLIQEAAKKFYRKNGYREIGREYKGRIFESVVFQKDISNVF